MKKILEIAGKRGQSFGSLSDLAGIPEEEEEEEEGTDSVDNARGSSNQNVSFNNDD